jgi:hypothetical protein
MRRSALRAGPIVKGTKVSATDEVANNATVVRTKNTAQILVEYRSNISKKGNPKNKKNPALAVHATSRVCTKNKEPNTHSAISTRKGTTNRCVLVGYVQQGVRVQVGRRWVSGILINAVLKVGGWNPCTRIP